MNKAERKKLVESWRAGEYRDERGLLGPMPSDVAEALGVEAAELRARDEKRQAEGLLLGRAAVAGVDPEVLAAADAAIAAELEARSRGEGPIDGFGQSQGGGNDPTLRLIADFVQASSPSVPGYAFVAAVAFAAGQEAKKK